MPGFGLSSFRESLEDRYLNRLGYGSGRQFISQLVSSVKPSDVLLDIGCGEGKLRRLLKDSVFYVGLDRYFGEQDNEYVDWNMRPDILADAHQLPIKSASCDTVALLHVLEHVAQPDIVFSEICRVLKPGGKLFADVPFLHQVHHAPHDYLRYTQFGLANISRIAGLEVVEIRPSGGYFRTVSYILEEAPGVVSGRSLAAFFVRLIFAYPLKGLGWLVRKLQYGLDLYDSKQEFSCGYHCIFRKPDSTGMTK